jgi:hypothetical protein
MKINLLLSTQSTSFNSNSSGTQRNPEGLFGKWRNQVDERGLKGILRNFDL